MAIKQPVVTTPSPVGEPAPPLAAGMRLKRTEFHRRYELHPEIRWAELIDGVVFMPSPVRIANHGDAQSDVICWLGHYRARTPGLRAAGNASVFLGDHSEVQPDALMRLESRAGGQATVTPDDYLDGAPELVVEVAASSAARDMRAKRAVYERVGVVEYLVVLTTKRQVVWFIRTAGGFGELPADDAGIIQSQTFPGLWLDTQALLAGDIATVLRTLDRGLDGPEHTAFVATLARRAAEG